VSTPADEEILAATADLREFIRVADEQGELVRIDDADPHLEIGALYELSLQHECPPALLFDRIKGCPEGIRVIMGVQSLLQRWERSEPQMIREGRGIEAVQAYRRRRREVAAAKPLPPCDVDTGPVLDNVISGEEVNILAFPTCKWHEDDGGAYIGTECLVINKDPDSDWVNVGTYRGQVQDAKTLTVFIEPGKHGDVIRRKYWERGQACPMVVCVGQSPILGKVAGTVSGSGFGESEFATAGGLLGRPIPVVRGRTTGVPFPAEAELVFEGLMPPPEEEARPEGPFGEALGYYGSGTRPEPVLRVQTIYHRDNPILVGRPPTKPTLPGRRWEHSISYSAVIWDAIEAANVPGITGVWTLPNLTTVIVALREQHAGHAKMAGLVAAGCGPGAYGGRVTIVVDDDIDITDLTEVMWAVGTRWDPATQTDIISGGWGSHIDPRIDPVHRSLGDITNSRIIIYAVRPYHWRDEFPAVVAVSDAYAAELQEKWAPRLAFVRDIRKP
jgi:4-hydroxy-3-polyprenylbenzoate decarboxylase